MAQAAMTGISVLLVLILSAFLVVDVNGQDWPYIANSLDPAKKALASWYNGQDACLQGRAFKVRLHLPPLSDSFCSHSIRSSVLKLLLVTFQGIVCSPTGQPVGVSLNGLKLNGVLPEQILQISTITLLDLGGNNLQGQIPGDIGNIQSLQVRHQANNDNDSCNFSEGALQDSCISTLRDGRSSIWRTTPSLPESQTWGD